MYFTKLHISRATAWSSTAQVKSIYLYRKGFGNIKYQCSLSALQISKIYDPSQTESSGLDLFGSPDMSGSREPCQTR